MKQSQTLCLKKKKKNLGFSFKVNLDYFSYFAY